MNESNNNFEELKRLLKLTQHEVPPPGYFNSFSGQVIARIRAGETGGSQSWADRVHVHAPWAVKLLRIFETKPGMMGGFATSLCLVLLIGVVMADRPDAVPSSVLASAAAESAPAAEPVFAGAAPIDNSGITVNTNPPSVVSFQPAPGLFGQQNPLFQAASFAPGLR